MVRQRAVPVTDAMPGMVEEAGQQRHTVHGVASHRHERTAWTTKATGINFIGDLVLDVLEDSNSVFPKRDGEVRWIDVCQLERPQHQQAEGVKGLPVQSRRCSAAPAGSDMVCRAWHRGHQLGVLAIALLPLPDVMPADPPGYLYSVGQALDDLQHGIFGRVHHHPPVDLSLHRARGVEDQLDLGRQGHGRNAREALGRTRRGSPYSTCQGNASEGSVKVPYRVDR